MILGCDVSFYQDANTTPEQIDFAKMKAEGAEFVYIRAAFGTVPDEDFTYNWQTAKLVGPLRGAYCFWNYWTGAPKTSAQVAFWKSMLQADPGEMPPALDMERANANYPELPAASVCFDALWQFHVMCKALGRRTMLYTNLATLYERLTPAPAWAVNEVDLWLAHWYIQPEQLKPAPWKKVTLWQQGLGKGRGYDFGCESKDIDIDYFMGTREELRAYAGVSIPPTPEPEPEPEPEQPPEEKPVSMFDQYPKGVMLTNHVADPAQLGGDFIAAKLGAGLTPYTHFHRQVQTAADAGLPLIAVYDNDPLVMIQQYESLNLAKWKAEIRDNRVIKEVLGPMIQSGGVNRRIHAVIITMNDIYEAPGKMTDPDWIYQTALALAYGVKTLYGLPVYLSIDASILRNIPTGEKDVFATFLSKLTAFDAETGRGYDGVMPGIGTYFSAPDISATGTWDAIPAPADSFNTKWSDEKRTSGLGHAPRVNFWCYSAGRVTLPGVGGVAPLYMYLGSKAGLYKELNFTGQPTEPEPEPEPEPDPEDPTPPPASGDLAALMTELLKIGADVKVIRAFIEDMRKL